MPDLQTIIDQFVKRWNVNEELIQATDSEIEQVESTLEIFIPEGYKQLVLKYGDIYTPDLLEAIVGQDIEYPDVQNFSLPKQALKDTKVYIDAGMPGGYLGFASDSMGNLFCFSIEDCKEKTSGGPVWFFDHDFVEIYKLADSFEDWLTMYVEINKDTNKNL